MAEKHIIVAVESPAEQQLLEKILTSNNFRVTVAAEGSEVVSQARQLHPDLILMGTVLHGVSGFQVTRKLRKDGQTQDIPVVILGGEGQSANESWAMRQGAKAFFVRPIQERPLLDKILVLMAGIPHSRNETGESTTQTEHDPGMLQQVEQQLAPHIGPLAKVLVQRAAQRTSSTAELYRLLATEIDDVSGRERFLANIEP